MVKAEQGQGYEVSATLGRQMLRYAASRGIKPEALLDSLGVDPALLDDPDARFPVDTYLAIQEEAARLTGDECFGLHMGEFTEPGSYSIVGYMMMNCCTLAEASEKSGRYERIIGTMIQGGVRFGLGTVTFLLSQPKHAPAMSRHCFESAMSGIVRMMRTLAGREIDPLEIRFSYPRPASTAEYERVFRCPVHFGRKATSITLPSGYGDLPVAASNPGLLAYFEDYAKRFLDGIDAKERYGRLVTKAILAHLDDESLSIRLVAKDLAMSPRTLQSRLKAEGRGFSELLDDTRHALARRYLRERQSVEDITYMLGFSEPSAFRKAFKKWSGLTPKEYRESMAETV